MAHHCVLTLCVDLLRACLKYPEPNEALYHFVVTHFLQLDRCEGDSLRLFPVSFARNLLPHFGLAAPCPVDERLPLRQQLDPIWDSYRTQLPGFRRLSSLEVVYQIFG